jgi:chorismate mutase-like protein
MTEHDGLAQLREELDRLDAELLDVVRGRLDCGLRIAAYKSANEVPMMQPHRVRLVKERAARYAEEHGIDPGFLVRLYELLIAEMCRVEDVAIAAAAGSSR